MVGAGSFLVDLWHKPARSSSDGGNWRLVSKGGFFLGIPADAGYLFQLHDGRLHFTVSDPNEVNHIAIRVPEPLPDMWHHLAGVLDRQAG